LPRGDYEEANLVDVAEGVERRSDLPAWSDFTRDFRMDGTCEVPLEFGGTTAPGTRVSRCAPFASPLVPAAGAPAAAASSAAWAD